LARLDTGTAAVPLWSFGSQDVGQTTDFLLSSAAIGPPMFGNNNGVVFIGSTDGTVLAIR
jgi:hypothetical protein